MAVVKFSSLTLDLAINQITRLWICRTNTNNPTGGDNYLHPSMQTTDGNYVIQSTDPRGYRRNRATGIVRVRRESYTTSWTEGVLTCRFHGISDPLISVGVYY